MGRIVVLFALSAALIGCATPSPFEGPEYESLRSQQSHPFTVSVKVDQQAGAAGEMTPMMMNSGERVAIEQAVVDALNNYNVFAAAYRAGNGVEPDLELRVNISAQTDQQMGEVNRNNLVWANLFLWLLAGFPGWILKDTEMSSGIDVKYEVVRPFTGETPEMGYQTPAAVDFAEAARLNFWNRAGLWQYVQQLIIPPFFVSSDMEKADRSLYEKFQARMQRDIGESVKAGIGRAQLDGSLPSLYVVPLSGSSDAYLFLFSPVPQEQTEMVAGEATATEPTEVEWTNLGSPAGQAILAEPSVVSALNSGLVSQAFSMFKERRGYVSGYVQKVPQADLTSDSPPRLKVFFANQEQPWTWTPSLRTTAATTN